MTKNIFDKFFKRKPIYELKNVFTPTTSANISYITRENVENKLRKALDIPGNALKILLSNQSYWMRLTNLIHIM